jgi:hypothetical protein
MYDTSQCLEMDKAKYYAIGNRGFFTTQIIMTSIYTVMRAPWSTLTKVWMLSSNPSSNKKIICVVCSNLGLFILSQ